MLINYALELQDWLNFNMYHFRNSPHFRRTRNQIWIAFTLFYFALALLPLFFNLSLIYSIAFGNIGILWLAFFPTIHDWFTLIRVKRFLKEGSNKGLLGPQELTLTSDTILVRSATAESKLSWETVEGVVITDDYIFLYVTAISALIIPKHSLKSRASFTEIGELANQYFEQYKLTQV